MILTLVIAAIMAVESHGNPAAIGDGGRAHGPLQIHREVIEDVNRFDGTSYTIADAHDPAKAEDIFRRYVRRYATRARLGHEPTEEDVARIWNGGPNGWRKPDTLGYWGKVRRHLKNRLYFSPPLCQIEFR